MKTKLVGLVGVRLKERIFSTSINKIFVSGHLVYDNSKFDESKKEESLSFKR